VKGVSEMNKKLLIFKRKKAKELHEKGWSNRKIARHILASKNSVGKWVQMNESEILTDNRGWEKGKSREYTPETKQQIIKIRKDLEKEEKGAEQIHEISGIYADQIR
jgi:transposase